ncbi:prenyltransferase [Ruania halotolerans]|uniref:prenyltransferase n=1 Tax=Ruania halotolerans TaxID=2897773 RepID=UPI001E6384BA|nr:prenyltransferase [Ruania halotolerans]UFU06876.1 prenyltransferase [Ruania halotolerans]
MTATAAAPSPWRHVLASSRPISWINTAYPFAAAYLLAGGGMDARLLIGSLFFLVPYNLLMYGLNDVWDYESDLHNPRKGGVHGVVLDRRLHRTTVVAAVASSVPFVLALALLGSPSATAVLAVSVFAVVAYSAPRLRFKERPVLDSVTSATHFVSPAVYGLALSGAPVSAVAMMTLLAFFAWSMASHAFGAVQDVNADRAGRIASIATWAGAAVTVRFALALYLLSAALLVVAGWPWWPLAVLAVPYLLSTMPYVRLAESEAERATAGWRRFLWLNPVIGFLLTQYLLWVAPGPLTAAVGP